MRTNQQWLQDLASGGMEQENAIQDIRDLLLRAVLYFFSRSSGDFAGLSQDEIMQRAEDCAQDALIALLAHLSDFRGESKFSTWAYKFAINNALMSARRERWKGISIDDLATSEADHFEGLLPDNSDGVSPEQSAAQGEITDIIRKVIESDLTEKQRRVLYMMVFNDVPMDEVVRHLSSNRNSIYKLLHDARQKLKTGLQTRGFEVGDALGIFSSSR